MSGWLTCVQLDAMALFQEAVAGQLTYKAVAKSNWFTAANTLCCWKDHTWLSQHQHDTIRNASLCLQGVSERCRDSRAIVVPSIDALLSDSRYTRATHKRSGRPDRLALKNQSPDRSARMLSASTFGVSGRSTTLASGTPASATGAPISSAQGSPGH